MHPLLQVVAMEEIKEDHITREVEIGGMVAEVVIVMGKMEGTDGVHMEDRIVVIEEDEMTEEAQVEGKLIIFSSLAFCTYIYIIQEKLSQRCTICILAGQIFVDEKETLNLIDFLAILQKSGLNCIFYRCLWC